jgi:hypothetical protein
VAYEGTDSCAILVSPFPTPVPEALEVRSVAAERRVRLIDSRKPNSLSILERVKELLEAERVALERIERKVHPVGGEESARIQAWARFRGLLVLGVFD